jgi:hypothetical protein
MISMSEFRKEWKAKKEILRAEMLTKRGQGMTNRALAVYYDKSTQWVNLMIGPEGKRKKRKKKR